MSNISIVIGSWGSYNECNDKALGSKWLDLADYSSFEEIEEELKKEGFELDGIDEELFIQDIDGLDSKSCNWDNTNPEELFNLLNEADVLTNDYNYDIMNAYLEVRSWSDFESLVNDKGSNWTDDIHLYRGYSWSDYGHEMIDCYGYQLPEVIENFIDYEAYGKYIGDYYAEEYSDGIIEIC